MSLATSEKYPYGASFQRKLLAMAFREPNFVDRYGYTLVPHFFDVPAFKHVAKILLEYSREHLRTPTADIAQDVVVGYCLDHRHDDGVKDELLEVVDDLVAEDLTEGDWVRQRAQEFAQAQALRDVILNGAKMLREGGEGANYAELVTDIQTAMEMGLQHQESYVFGESALTLPDLIREQQGSDARTIPTGVDRLDHDMLGGISPSQIGVVMAPSKRGKSHALVSFGVAALRHGFGVHHYTIQDLKAFEVATRYASNITGIPSQNVVDDPAYHARMAKYLERYQPKLVVNFFPADTLTPAALASHVSSNAARTGIHPDLIILDYADLLSSGQKPTFNSAEKSEMMGWLYKQLLKMIDKTDSAMWTAMQVSGSNWEDELITASAYTRSRQIIEHSHFVVSINQKREERKHGKARLYSCAFRRGEDQQVIPISLNKATSTLKDDKTLEVQRVDDDDEIEDTIEAEAENPDEKIDPFDVMRNR